MPNFCPSCGTKVEEGNKFCLSCGIQLQNTDTPPSNKPNSQEPPATQQQPLEQSGITPAIQPKKSKNILFVSIIAIIAIVIIAVLVFIFLSGGVLDSRFVGEWEQYDAEFMTFDWNFKNDGSLEIMGMDLATWSVKNNQLCISYDELWEEYIPEGSLDEVCYNFEFSDGGNTLTLSLNGSEFTVLTKK
ncbi:MAG: zinc-ribbon domain-containing protein [Thermoplasmatales archaeon]|nr:MAG: zinc-ribbon domain-containing protein [Thermoplasmatales archaeon]